MGTATREVLRDGLVTKYKTMTGLGDDAGAVAHVFSCLPPTFNGLSPVQTLENGGWKPYPPGDPTAPVYMRVIAGFWVKITSSTATERPNVEDVLDAHADEQNTMLSRYYNATYYETSQTDYEVMDGADYRVEWSFIEIQL